MKQIAEQVAGQARRGTITFPQPHDRFLCAPADHRCLVVIGGSNTVSEFLSICGTVALTAMWLVTLKACFRNKNILR